MGAVGMQCVLAITTGEHRRLLRRRRLQGLGNEQYGQGKNFHGVSATRSIIPLDQTTMATTNARCPVKFSDNRKVHFCRESGIVRRDNGDAAP